MVGSEDVVTRLLDGGIDVEAKDLVGFTALDLALDEEQWGIAKLLRSKMNT
jgi:ankyrin repeat protein